MTSKTNRGPMGQILQKQNGNKWAQGTKIRTNPWRTVKKTISMDVSDI